MVEHFLKRASCSFVPKATSAKLSFERKTGARGLRAIMEDVMTDVMYEVPSEDDIKECVITKEAVLDKESPKLIMDDDEVRQDSSMQGAKSA